MKKRKARPKNEKAEKRNEGEMKENDLRRDMERENELLGNKKWKEENLEDEVKRKRSKWQESKRGGTKEDKNGREKLRVRGRARKNALAFDFQ